MHLNTPKSQSTALAATSIIDFVRKYFELTYKDISPVNLSLSLLIILLNSVVIAHYRRKLNNFTSVLFFCIAVSNTLAAVGSFLFSVEVLLWSADPVKQDVTMWWFYLLYRIIGLAGYAASIFFNTLLAVSRTIVICDPFYRPSILMMQVFSAVFVTFLVVLVILDVSFMAHQFPAMRFEYVLVYFYVVVSLRMSGSLYVGQSLAWFVYEITAYNTALTSAVQFSLLAILYLLPVLVVLVSMIVQLIVVRRMRSITPENDHYLNNWRHINTTVFLLTSLFLVCNGALTADTIVVQVLYTQAGINFDHSPAEFRVFGMVQTILPLVNSLLAPVVLVLRNARMRQEIRSKVRNMLLREAENNVDVQET